MRHGGGSEGYTLIEIMIVVVILGILVLTAVASFSFTTNRSYRITCLANQRSLNDAVTSYASVKGSYPEQVSDLAEFVYSTHKATTCPKDGRSLVYDSVTHEVTCPNHPVW